MFNRLARRESLMISSSITWVALWLAAASPETVVLTPDNMREHGFFVDCRVFEMSEHDRAERASPEVGVLVRFDTFQGAAIAEFEAGRGAENTVVLRDGDEVLLSAPVEIVPWDGNDGGVAAEFAVRRDLLDEVEFVLHKEGVGSFRIDVNSFLTAPSVPVDAAYTAALTPVTMAEHNFFIDVESWETSDFDLEHRGAAPVSVRICFDPMRGPAIEDFAGNASGPESAYLIVREGEEVLINVPVSIFPWDGNDGGLAIEFSVQEYQLDDAELRLYEGGIGMYTVDIASFLASGEE
jgi:hypothetical protein